MVVPVLMTNCQVSENLKTGPDTSQVTIIKKAIIKAAVLPVALVTTEEIFSNPDGDVIFFAMINLISEYGKGAFPVVEKHYTIKEKSYIIHTFSSVLRFLCLSDLKKEGVRPVIFLNWLESAATLL